jgi:hypothetical protein
MMFFFLFVMSINEFVSTIIVIWILKVVRFSLRVIIAQQVLCVLGWYSSPCHGSVSLVIPWVWYWRLEVCRHARRLSFHAPYEWSWCTCIFIIISKLAFEPIIIDCMSSLILLFNLFIVDVLNLWYKFLKLVRVEFLK